MRCPYCGEPLDNYENYENFRDDETIEVTEHYACYECDRTFWRNMIYKVEKKGMLYE